MKPSRRATDRFGALHLNNDLVVGGVERVIVNLANEMRAEGLSVGVLAAVGGDLWKELGDAVEQYPLGPRRGLLGNLRWLLALRRVVRRDSWRVVHAHQRGLALLARLALLGTSSPVIEHVHSLFEPTLLNRIFSFRGHRLIACGPQVGSMLEHRFNRPRSRISVVMNAVVDPGEIEWRRDATKLGSLCIIGIGRLSDEKDPFRFVDVVLALREAGYECSASWFGDGPLRDGVERHIRSVGLEGVVRLPGVTSEVGAEIGAADVVLLTSKREGLPLTILEGMGVGRPVAAPDVGSCADVIQDGVNGILFDVSSSPLEIAQRLADAHTSGRLEEYGRAARKSFVETCSLESMTRRVLEQYEIALEEDIHRSRRR
jgi:glycosyltransferase involved in cell wall biosynthesis